MRAHKTRRLRGGAIISDSKPTTPVVSSPTITSAAKPTTPLAPAPTKVNPEAVIQTLMSSLMRNPSNFPILSKMQSQLTRQIIFNPAVTVPILSFLTDSLILILRDPGVNTALTTALANLK